MVHCVASEMCRLAVPIVPRTGPNRAAACASLLKSSTCQRTGDPEDRDRARRSGRNLSDREATARRPTTVGRRSIVLSRKDREGRSVVRRSCSLYTLPFGPRQPIRRHFFSVPASGPKPEYLACIGPLFGPVGERGEDACLLPSATGRILDLYKRPTWFFAVGDRSAPGGRRLIWEAPWPCPEKNSSHSRLNVAVLV